MKKHRPSPQENLPGSEHGVIAELYRRFGADAIAYQPTVDGLPTAWVPRAQLPEVLRFLRDARFCSGCGKQLPAAPQRVRRRA